MRLSGTLRLWNDDRGFGFIAPTQGGAELFVHISALPRDGSRPTAGERVTYELGRGRDGRPQAVNVQRRAVGNTTERAHVHRRETKQKSSLFTRVIWFTILLGLGAFGFTQYQERSADLLLQSKPSISKSELATLPATQAQGFNCDGRTHCSQMTSCTEAKLFLKNCPGTQMDGNNDGTPCEQQWCTSPFSK